MLNYLMTTGRPENELIDKLQQKAEDKGFAQGFAKGKAEAAAQVARYLKQAGYKLNENKIINSETYFIYVLN